jgi:hypothetical protein
MLTKMKLEFDESKEKMLTEKNDLVRGLEYKITELGTELLERRNYQDIENNSLTKKNEIEIIQLNLDFNVKKFKKYMIIMIL